MDLKSYKTLTSTEQRKYLLDNFNNPKFITDVKNNFQDFIKNTHINNYFDFIEFYTLLAAQKQFQQEIIDNILTIMDIQSKKIFPATIYRILKLADKDMILNNPFIQKRLIEYTQQALTAEETFLIIEKYIKEDYHNELFLKQIKNQIKNSKTKDEIEFTETFIKCLINDPTYGVETLKYVGKGQSKICFKLNDYVLQIGSLPTIIANKKSEQVISPILFITNNNTLISMTPYLEPATDEEVKECWFKAKDENILFLDPIEDNFGKHPNDFQHPFKDITPLGKHFLGIDKFYIGDSQKSEVKLLDIDYYIDENDKSKKSENLKENYKDAYHDLKVEYERQKQLKLFKKDKKTK